MALGGKSLGTTKVGYCCFGTNSGYELRSLRIIDSCRLAQIENHRSFCHHDRANSVSFFTELLLLSKRSVKNIIEVLCDWDSKKANCRVVARTTALSRRYASRNMTIRLKVADFEPDLHAKLSTPPPTRRTAVVAVGFLSLAGEQLRFNLFATSGN